MAELSYRRHRFPAEIIQHAIWLYLRFTLSYRDVEDLLAERGLDLSYETVRRWVLKFGPSIAAPAAPASPSAERPMAFGKMVVWIAGVRMYLWPPSTTRARSWTCWYSVDATAGRPEIDAQASQEARLRAEITGDRQTALLRLGVPAIRADLPS